ncbi:hypothetical protein CEXT_305241 [Caerostris extrusa]|uniref:Uncharacterized protein n=1 Tax=Caerostris extrusa TaxID=172846 RepID=A0AAV4XBA0_CAEEX|nr:hypothetical protein CEXT_305241 [Caerostris extrusa]
MVIVGGYKCGNFSREKLRHILARLPVFTSSLRALSRVCVCSATFIMSLLFPTPGSIEISRGTSRRCHLWSRLSEEEREQTPIFFYTVLGEGGTLCTLPPSFRRRGGWNKKRQIIEDWIGRGFQRGKKNNNDDDDDDDDEKVILMSNPLVFVVAEDSYCQSSMLFDAINEIGFDFSY